jgi:hypothetical protein
MENRSITINVNGTKQEVHVYREAVVAWAIHTTKDREDITVERITPLTVDLGRPDCRWNAQPDSEEGTQFVAEYNGGVPGSVRFIQAEPGMRLVVAYCEGVGDIDLGIECAGSPVEVSSEYLAKRVADLIIANKRKQEKAAAR